MEFIIKLRTVRQCVDEIKKIDKDTAISEWFVRSLCKRNEIKYVTNGNKVLVNFESLVGYLNGEYVKEKTTNEK